MVSTTVLLLDESSTYATGPEVDSAFLFTFLKPEQYHDDQHPTFFQKRWRITWAGWGELLVTLTSFDKVLGRRSFGESGPCGSRARQEPPAVGSWI